MIEPTTGANVSGQPTVEKAADDVQRLSAALDARRRAAPDNVVELAALAFDLQRASAALRLLVSNPALP